MEHPSRSIDAATRANPCVNASGSRGRPSPRLDSPERVHAFVHPPPHDDDGGRTLVEMIGAALAAANGDGAS